MLLKLLSRTTTYGKSCTSSHACVQDDFKIERTDCSCWFRRGTQLSDMITLAGYIDQWSMQQGPEKASMSSARSSPSRLACWCKTSEQ